MSGFHFREDTAPGTPATGYIVIYGKTDSLLYFKADDGVEKPVKPTGGGTGDLLSDGSVPLSANWDVGAFTITGTRFISDIATGTAPFGASSTTVVANLNVDQVDGKDSTDLVLVDGSQALTANWDVGSFKITAETMESDVTTGTAPLTVASTTVVANLNSDQVDGADLIDEDNMSSDSAVHVPTQQSVKAYVDAVDVVESFIIAVSDEVSSLTTGTEKVTFRMPYAFTLTAVRASVTTAPTGSVLTVDINETGSTILSTKLTIDVTEKTSTTAAIAAVISDTSLADDAEMTIDIDTIGSTVAGKGLKVTLIGSKT